MVRTVTAFYSGPWNQMPLFYIMVFSVLVIMTVYTFLNVFSLYPLQT